MTKKDIEFLKWSKKSVTEIIKRNQYSIVFLKKQKNKKRLIKKLEKLINDGKMLLKSYNRQLRKANK